MTGTDVITKLAAALATANAEIERLEIAAAESCSDCGATPAEIAAMLVAIAAKSRARTSEAMAMLGRSGDVSGNVVIGNGFR